MIRAIAIATGLALAGGALAANAATPADEAGIRAVVEQFRSAIVDKDKPRFLATLLQPGITWQWVNSDATITRAQVKHPEVTKAKPDATYTATSFIDNVVDGAARKEERFGPLAIDSDGDAASVAFDYQFLIDGREANHGREYWTLVRTESGWKIASVVWSVSLPPATH